MWEELDHYETFKLACQQDAMVYKEKMERTKIFEFLVGLNVGFEFVWVHILRRDVLRSLNEVHAFVLSEESGKNVV